MPASPTAPPHGLKRILVCYRGLRKNRHRLVAACALANLHGAQTAASAAGDTGRRQGHAPSRPRSEATAEPTRLVVAASIGNKRNHPGRHDLFRRSLKEPLAA